MKKLLSFIFLSIANNLLAGPRIIDESLDSPIPLPLTVVLIIALAILFGWIYFSARDKNGKKDDGFGCLLWIAIIGAVIGIIALCN